MPLKKGTTTIGAIYKGTTPIAKVYKGTTLVFESGLPKEYTELKYIESTGTQYIDTGIYVNKYIKTEVDFQIVEINSSSVIFGVYQSSLGACRYYGVRVDGYQSAYDGSKAFGLNTNYSKHNYIYNANAQGDIYFDGVYAGSLGVYNFEMNQTMALFARKGSNGTIADFSKVKYYFCKIYDNGTIVRSFVPCYRNSDGEIGLYDKVNGVFYTNAGTGTFVKGPVAKLPSAYQEVEYIESSGTQYIDTGIGSNENTGCYIDIQITINANQNTIGVLEPGVGRFAPYFMDSDYYIKTAINLQNQMVILTQTNTFDRHTCEYNVNNRNIKFDGISKGTVGSIGSTNNHIYLFCRNYSSSPFYARAKLYSCKLYDSGVLTRNFVPCYNKTSGIIGLYDLVGKQFYTNDGTGTFTKGNDVL